MIASPNVFLLKRLQNSQEGASALGGNQQVMGKASNLRTSLSSPCPPHSPLMGTWVCGQSMCFYPSLHKEVPLICSEARFSSTVNLWEAASFPKELNKETLKKATRILYWNWPLSCTTTVSFHFHIHLLPKATLICSQLAVLIYGDRFNARWFLSFFIPTFPGLFMFCVLSGTDNCLLSLCSTSSIRQFFFIWAPSKDAPLLCCQYWLFSGIMWSKVRGSPNCWREGATNADSFLNKSRACKQDIKH